MSRKTKKKTQPSAQRLALARCTWRFLCDLILTFFIFCLQLQPCACIQLRGVKVSTRLLLSRRCRWRRCCSSPGCRCRAVRYGASARCAACASSQCSANRVSATPTRKPASFKTAYMYSEKWIKKCFLLFCLHSSEPLACPKWMNYCINLP